MKTTVELSPALLDEAKRIAREEGTTLRALIEAGLRSELARRQQPQPFALRDASFHGRGLQPEFADGGWERIRDAIYEGRGA
ncbi:MAG: DUF2191 domain-containing protein [Egibacteraceae bacterium]